MASVKVAVRVRPLNRRELDMESKFIIQIENKKTSITNLRIPENAVGDVCRERIKDFTFDYSYMSVNKKLANYASQEQVFQDLGLDVVSSAYEGYNACVFAYGQTGSGKTYTMMGNAGDAGIIPRICQELFVRMKDEDMSYRTEVSYLEIYNEKVRDLLKGNQHSKIQHSLRVREHPKEGPYVQDLSKHLVMNYSDILELMQKGNENRTTASTLMNDVSSRSHAIFTIVFTQAKFSKECPLETQSKIHLVDLAGSERADSSGATGQRLKEGGSINKSLVTLGNVISALADLSEKGNNRKSVFIPYRDSVLTWLLKDSLGGNAKTMMIATVSPADCNYGETMSTLRYANRAKNIINKPHINEDPNVKLIRELRAEIARLRDLLGNSAEKTFPRVQEKLTENEARIKILTDEWAGKWAETTKILEEESMLALRKAGRGVVLDSDLPHLIGIDDDILSTGIMLYHLKQGETSIGADTDSYQPDIVLQGPELHARHCTIDHCEGVVTLRPSQNALCTVNGFVVTEPVVLTQGAVILLGRTNMFRFNHPSQVAQLKRDFKGSNLNLSRVSLLSQSMNDLCRSTENLSLNTTGFELERKHQQQLQVLDTKRQEIEDMETKYKQSELRRLAEQHEQELELNNKRRQLEHLRSEAEMMKEQAEKAKKRADREAARYKRRSMDVERQLQDFMDNEGMNNQNAGTPSHKERILNELQKEIERKKELLQQEREQELQLLQTEREQLELMTKDCTNFTKFQTQLGESTRDRLRLENERLLSAQRTLSERERLLYEQHQLEEKQILDEKKKALKLIEDEKWELEADKIYVRELETNLRQMSDEARTDAEKEELERERDALEEEKAKITHKENELEQKLKNVDRDCEKKQQELQEKRNQQIDSLNVSRRQVRDIEADWSMLVQREIQNQDRTIEEVEMRIQDGEEELEGLEDRFTSIAAQVNACRALHDNESVAASSTSKMEKDFSVQATSISIDNSQLNTVSRKEVRFVDSCSVGTMARSDSSDESPTEADYSSVLAEERKHLFTKMQELSDLEEQLRSNESDIDDKRRQFEEQRQQELYRIERERLNLQEMEDQERIGALVEQEVRRRLLEERVERERSWLMKRDAEQVSREQELARIRKSHQRELLRLQERYEGNLASDNMPTRANPYATFTSGDASQGLSRANSKRCAMERAASIASIHSAVSAMSPITGNPFSVTVPTYLHRGSGLDVYYEYEIKLAVLDDKWSVFRRYRRFRELHMELKLSYPEIAGLVFPPKKFFGSRSEKTVAERRLQLENYLRHVLEILWRKPESPLNPAKVKHYSKRVLTEFNTFFKKGVFETGKYSTG